MKPLLILLLFIVMAALAFFINKLLLKALKPRASFNRFLLYLAVNLVLVFFYARLVGFLLLKIIWSPNK